MILSEQPVLQVNNLTLHAGQKILIDDLSFLLYAGERLCLLGASGSGKSLTAQALTGTLPPGIAVSGEIMVNGIDVAHQPALQRSTAGRVAAIFQDSASALHPLFTVAKQLKWVAGSAQQGSLSTLLDAAGLHGLGDRYPGELSGGQRQRICALMALLSSSNVLVADEPTTALDVVAQQQVTTLLQQGKQALLFITHDIAVAARLCQRVVILEQGVAIENGSMQRILRSPQQPFTRTLIAAARQNSDLILTARQALAG